MVGESSALKRGARVDRPCAPTPKASVLITGESGTGKELVARAIHGNSPRAEGPFIKVNCAAIPEELIESELFGHVKGSFTGATKDQIGKFVAPTAAPSFLDEIGDMSLKTRPRCCALQDGEVEPVGAAKTLSVDVRVFAATNKLSDRRDRRGPVSARTSISGSTSCRSRFRRCASAARTSSRWWLHFADEFCEDNNYKPKTFTTPAALDALRRGRPGAATCASCATPSSGC